MTIESMQNRPLAAPGLISYRYPSQYCGYIMIGAKDHSDALLQAARSMTRGASNINKLEIWNGESYILVVSK